MTLVRILVDGKSLLQNWKDLAPGNPPHPEALLEELVNRLTSYYDACGTPLTLVLGTLPGLEDPAPISSLPEVEIHWCHQDHSLAQFLERMARRLASAGDVLVVTDLPDLQERIQKSGGQTCGSQAFISLVKAALDELEKKILLFNQTEQKKFSRHG